MSDDKLAGPAFPTEQGSAPDGTWNQTYDPGITLRQYACIHLKVPDSGLPELDALIEKSLLNDFVGKAMQGLLAECTGNECVARIEEGPLAEFSCRYAAAMLAEKRRIEKGA